MAARGTESGQNAWEKTKDKYVEISQIVRGDLKGWSVCLAVLVITVVRSGITYSFGMFVVELEKEFPDMTMAEQSESAFPCWDSENLHSSPVVQNYTKMY